MPLRAKVLRPEIRAVNETDNTVTAVVSSESIDREGDVIRVAGWDLKSFRKHPVLLADHNYFDIRSQIGEWTSMKVDRSAKELVGTAKYYAGAGNEKADWAFELAKRGKAAFSVGFIPDASRMQRREDDDGKFAGIDFRGQELLEVSHVTVPANPEGLQRAVSMGGVVGEIADEVIADSDFDSMVEIREMLHEHDDMPRRPRPRPKAQDAEEWEKMFADVMRTLTPEMVDEIVARITAELAHSVEQNLDVTERVIRYSPESIQRAVNDGINEGATDA